MQSSAGPVATFNQKTAYLGVANAAKRSVAPGRIQETEPDVSGVVISTDIIDCAVSCYGAANICILRQHDILANGLVLFPVEKCI